MSGEKAKKQKTAKTQINTLIKVNNTRIQKQENEIAKLMAKKNKVLNLLDEKDKEIQDMILERNDFKSNYFKKLPGKVFNTQQVNFFRNNLEIFEFKITDLRSQKEKIQKELNLIELNISKHKAELKKYSFKHEKYDYLKLSFG